MALVARASWLIMAANEIYLFWLMDRAYLHEGQRHGHKLLLPLGIEVDRHLGVRDGLDGDKGEGGAGAEDANGGGSTPSKSPHIYRPSS